MINFNIVHIHSPPLFTNFTTKTIFMKKTSCLFFALFYFSICCKAQLDKGTWLVGGNGSFNSSKKTFTADYILPSGVAYYQITSVKLSPNIGYFFTDKFAGGVKVSLDWFKQIQNINGIGGGVNNNLTIDYGLFSRYYFLNRDNQLNFLIDGAYQIGNARLGNYKGERKNYMIMVGPAIFFNSSVSIEFLSGYIYQSEKIRDNALTYDDIKKGFQFNIGLQIHLKK